MLVAMTLVGLATVPTRGADSHLERPKPRVSVPAADLWRLRPAEPILPSTTGSISRRGAAPIPEERRKVRHVYPALVEPR
jgi:hypothetical protein